MGRFPGRGAGCGGGASGAGLVPASPPGPVQSVGDAVQGLVEQAVQPLDLRDGERDQAGIIGWLLVLTARLSGHQVVINGNALCPVPFSPSWAAMPVGAETAARSAVRCHARSAARLPL